MGDSHEVRTMWHLCELCGEWYVKPPCPSCLEKQCKLYETCGVLYPRPPLDHTCIVGHPEPSDKNYYLFRVNM